jgi:AraC family transcriptional regulator
MSSLAVKYSPAETLFRLGLPIVGRRFVEWGLMRIDLLSVAKGASSEIEFAVPSHILMTHLQGAIGGYEWTDGTEWRRMAVRGPGSVIFNPAHKYLRIRKRAHGRSDVLLITIDPTAMEFLADENFDTKQVKFQRNVDLNDEGLCRFLAAIREEVEHPGPGGKRYCESLVILLLGQLVRCASNFAVRGPPTYTKGGLPSWKLKRALEIIETELTGSPSLVDLASRVGTHPTSFCRAFKQSIGISPHRYLLERRVARAKEMMAEDGLTLAQIALDCGFSTPSRLSVIFRRVTGSSPSVYRKSL